MTELVTIRRTRLSDIDPDAMTTDQKAVAEEAVAGRRGRLPAPLRAWLHSPELGRRAQKLGEFVRYETNLGSAVSELAILVTARHWTCHYEWYVHKGAALAAGLDSAAVAAIAAGQSPTFQEPKLAVVYDYAVALHRSRTVPDATHAAARDVLGDVGLVELVGLLGYYTLVAMTLNAFEIGPPHGEPLELQPL